jgi:hypothetical protein
VRLLTGAGKGICSRKALKTLMGLVGSALDRHEKVFITIKSKPLTRRRSFYFSPLVDKYLV